MDTRAQWATDVPDLYGEDLGKVRDYLTLAAVSEKTGLSPNTLKDALSRPPVTKEDNPMRYLSRPAARISNAPYYSKEQVAKAMTVQGKSAPRHLGGGKKALEVVTPEAAAQAELISIVEIAEYAGIHEQTVRRWVREQDIFPCAVALRARASEQGAHPGGPIVVYELHAVQQWLRDYIETNRDNRAERIAQHLRKVHGWKIALGSRVTQ